MSSEAGELGDAQLRFARLQRAAQLVAVPDLPDPDLDELSLWVGLHNVLALDHPERRRVWARAVTWQKVERLARDRLGGGAAVSGGPVPSRGESLARHVVVGAFSELSRDDTVVSTVGGELRFFGQTPPARRFGVGALGRTGTRTRTVRWIEQPHTPEVQRLLPAVFESSPLTCLLMPRRAPADWNPLVCARFLRERALARAVCYTWAKGDGWIATGGRVMAGLLAALDAASGPGGSDTFDGIRPPEVDRARVRGGQAAILAAVVGALIHLHFLKVLEFEARVGVALGASEPGIREFLALPLLLPHLEPLLGSPLGGVESGTLDAQRRFTEYVEHLGELVPRSITQNLVATLLPHIVQTG